MAKVLDKARAARAFPCGVALPVAWLTGWLILPMLESLAVLQSEFLCSGKKVRPHACYRARNSSAGLTRHAFPRRFGLGSKVAIVSHCSPANSFRRFFMAEAQPFNRFNRKYLS